MRKMWSVGLVLMMFCCAIAFDSQAGGTAIRGDYIEVRTASVFAGACHYNGEFVTTGRDALMAWNVASGVWQGVDLRGVRAMAVVAADANLSDTQATHRSELIIDTAATNAQAAAMVEALRSSYATTLGHVASVRRAPVTFSHKGTKYNVSASHLAAIDVEAMPDDECCKMPHLVWYAPLVPLANRKVGYTKNALYLGHTIGDAWQRAGENSAFYGSFSL